MRYDFYCFLLVFCINECISFIYGIVCFEINILSCLDVSVVVLIVVGVVGVVYVGVKGVEGKVWW